MHVAPTGMQSPLFDLSRALPIPAPVPALPYSLPSTLPMATAPLLTPAPDGTASDLKQLLELMKQQQLQQQVQQQAAAALHFQQQLMNPYGVGFMNGTPSGPSILGALGQLLAVDRAVAPPLAASYQPRHAPSPIKSPSTGGRISSPPPVDPTDTADEFLYAANMTSEQVNGLLAAGYKPGENLQTWDITRWRATKLSRTQRDSAINKDAVYRRRVKLEEAQDAGLE